PKIALCQKIVRAGNVDGESATAKRKPVLGDLGNKCPLIEHVISQSPRKENLLDFSNFIPRGGRNGQVFAPTEIISPHRILLAPRFVLDSERITKRGPLLL